MSNRPGLRARATFALAFVFICAWPSGVRAGRPYLDIDGHEGGIGNIKAVEVGDIVTVLIVESATGNTQAKTDANTKTEVGGGPGLGMLNFISAWGLESENKFKGDGKSSRTGALEAQMSTRVIEELPNGHLRLKGERMVEINGERQRITLSGIVRPEDIQADNTVLSTYIADAIIGYSGQGPMSEVHSPGLLSRIANFLF